MRYSCVLTPHSSALGGTQAGSTPSQDSPPVVPHAHAQARKGLVVPVAFSEILSLSRWHPGITGPMILTQFSSFLYS